jgi:hypothetical protein
MSAREAIIQVLDAPLSDDVCHGVTEAVAQKRWYFGNASVVGEDPGFWKMDLDGEPALDALWGALRAPCEELARARLTVIRQYANGHTYGLGGRTHADDTRPGHYTLLYYPMPEWHPDWGGETVFHRTNGDIALAVLPKPKRAILFDARIPHEGRAPSRNFGGLRVTIAFKLGPAGEPK